jgi:uncharacterized protein (TIGR00297 family)
VLPEFASLQLLVGFGLALVAALIAMRLGMLSGSGAVAATVLGGLIYGLGGLPWAVLLIAFFVSSSLLSRAFGRRKRSVASNFAKGGRRDWAQVAANGGAGLLFLIATTAGWLPAAVAWAGYAGALATVNADTWATELGILSAGQPRLISTGKRVPKGTSGGISLPGSVAALAGAALIAGLALWLGSLSLALLIAVSVAGLLGSYVDSLLGATVQAIYYCPKCKKETERHPLHSCGTATRHTRGWAWMNNDWVNFLSSAAGAMLAAAAARLLL